jgi:translation initiation factor IF-3
LKRISDETADLSMVEQEAKREGRQMFMVLAHK